MGVFHRKLMRSHSIYLIVVLIDVGEYEMIMFKCGVLHYTFSGIRITIHNLEFITGEATLKAIIQ